MIECEECGTKYTPISDSYRCPCCGESNYPDVQLECRATNYCNVCGIKLRTRDEGQMGMCERCASE